MSQPHASSSISTPLTTTRSSNFQAIFEAALKEYEKMTKIDLLVHPFASQLDSPAAILTTLQDQAEQSRSGDERLKRWLVPTINVLHAFSGTLEGVSSVNVSLSVEGYSSYSCLTGLPSLKGDFRWCWCPPPGMLSRLFTRAGSCDIEIS